MVAFVTMIMMRQQFLKRLFGLGAAVTTTSTINITTGFRNGFSKQLGTAHLEEFRGQIAGFRCGSSSFSEMAMGGASPFIRLLPLNDLRDNKGSRKKKTRKGRGIGSGKGKTAGRGHKGQKARGSYKFGFEGGQTPLRRLLPRRGFKNRFSLTFQPVSLRKIAKLINAGRIDSSELITMKTLKDVQAVGKQIEDGVRLMGRGAEDIHWPIHIEVSRVTARAKEAVEAAGGSVRRVYYNRLGLKALLKPEWFEKKGRLLPRPARPPPKQRSKVDSIGRLPAPTTPLPLENTQTSTQA